jgi:thiol:disulfide interchange protein DsbD
MRNSPRYLPYLISLLLGSGLAAMPPAIAAEGGGLDAILSSGSSADEFLPPDQAFRLRVAPAGPDQLQLTWVIAQGYYLYRDRLKFATDTPGVTLGKPQFPAGDTHTDEFFGTQIVYHDSLVVPMAVARAGGAAQNLQLNVTYQGCAEAGLCYPPQTTPFDVALPAGGSNAAVSRTTSADGAFVSEQDQKASFIRNGNLLAVLAAFFGSGLLLAFTPCCLPMVPILSGMIAGSGHRATSMRGFVLALAYVLGMAVTYTVAGAATAASGLQVQALFQQSWVILLFAALFVVMAASMFGLFTLQMPVAIQTRLASLSNRQRAGHLGGVAVMGALSALIVTACVAPAMVGALAVIGQSGDVARGAGALFAMSLGMGAPLLIVGASAGRWLPKAGAWMDDIKRLFGAMMLGVAAWMLARLVADRYALLLFAVPTLIGAVILWRFAARGTALKLARVVAVGCGLYTAALLYGSFGGATDPLRPLSTAAVAGESPAFQRIRTVADLDRQVAAAARAGKSVMLDFYADWCVSCKEMERYTFGDAAVKPLLEKAVLLRADVTANNEADQALLQRFGIFGPPTIAFYGPNGTEKPEYRVVGYMKAPAFADLLARALPALATPAVQGI